MSMIDGVNGGAKNAQVSQSGTPNAPIDVKSKANEKLNQELMNELSGANRKETSQAARALTPNEAKELIKYYQEQGYSKKEARALLNSKAERLEMMSRKEAKAWCKNYMQENGCSKKEAKQAFKEEFGYSVPLSSLQKGLRQMATMTPLGAIATIVDGFAGGKLGVMKFVTGQGNNDGAWVMKKQV